MAKKARIAPVHPGVYLKELLEELELSQYRLAHDIGVPAMRISHIVRMTRPVTAEIALRLGRYFGQSPRYWLNLQSRYEWTWRRMHLANGWPGKSARSRLWRNWLYKSLYNCSPRRGILN